MNDTLKKDTPQQHIPACAWNQSGGKESCSCGYDDAEYWNRQCVKAEELRDLYQTELGKTKLELSEMTADCTSWMERAEKAEALRDLYWDWLNTSLPPCPEDHDCDCPRCRIEAERKKALEEKP
jgi:hypothetical protein